jgi:hypothetical protein
VLIRWVKQEEPCGCGIACLAMLTGVDYWTVRRAWPDEHNFATGGIDCHDATHYLGDRGIAHVMRYRFELGLNRVGAQVIRRDWPQPFAPGHIIAINGSRHDVVLLADGTVLDPQNETPRRLEDVGEVFLMIGVWPDTLLPFVSRSAA